MSTTPRYRLRLFAAGTAVLAIAAAAPAQSYGQWTWEGRITARERIDEFMESGRVVSELRERGALLSLGLNGYIMHPAIAAFRLGVDTNLLRHSAGATIDTRKLGYRGDVRIFPTGVYPVHLYLSRQNYTYILDDVDSPSTPIGTVPGGITTLGARVRVRSGPLTGLVARSERSRITLLGPVGGVETQQYQFADWARSGKSWLHHYRLDRQARTFAAGGYHTDDITLLADATYRTASWQWASSSQLVRRAWSSDKVDGSRTHALRLQNRLLRTVSPSRAWEVQHSAGLTLADERSHSHSLGGRYSFAVPGHFTIAPFANVSVQSSDATRMFAPQAGLSATWTAGKGSFNTVISGAASSVLLNLDGDDFAERDSAVNVGAGVSLSFRPRRGLHSQLDTYASRNDLRKSGETIGSDSILIPIGGVGTENRMQARMTLGRNWSPLGVHLYVDWTAQEASGDLQINPFRSETLSSTLQLTRRNFSVSMSAANVTLEQKRPQEIDFVTAAARLRLGQTLSVIVSHREETRTVIGEPEADGSRSEGGLSLRLGSYSIEPQAFISTQRSGGAERSNRGLTVTITRGFGGVLPIISGVERRGVVR